MLLLISLVLFQDVETADSVSKGRLELRTGKYENAAKTLRAVAKKCLIQPRFLTCWAPRSSWWVSLWLPA